MAAVLLVDAYSDERDMYAEYLRARGHSVTVIEDPRYALAHAVRRCPDVVISRTPPPLGGRELTLAFKRHPRTSHVPVIVITSTMERENRVASIRAGCDAYMLLPASPRELERTIYKMMARSRYQRSRRQKA